MSILSYCFIYVHVCMWFVDDNNNKNPEESLILFGLEVNYLQKGFLSSLNSVISDVCLLRDTECFSCCCPYSESQWASECTITAKRVSLCCSEGNQTQEAFDHLGLVLCSSSQLDTLSKEDLIKFAKKQIVAMQKMKSKCAGEIMIVASLL